MKGYTFVDKASGLLDQYSSLLPLSDSISSASFECIEDHYHWIQDTLLPSTSQLRSSSVFQGLQWALWIWCLFVVPWAVFVLTLRTTGTDENTRKINSNQTTSSSSSSSTCNGALHGNTATRANGKKNVDGATSMPSPQSDENMNMVDMDSDMMGSGGPPPMKDVMVERKGTPTEELVTDDEASPSTLQDSAPLHFNSLRSPARLRGLSRPSGSRSSSFSRSRSTSPVMSSSRDVAGEVCTSEKAHISRSSSERSLESPVAMVMDKNGHSHVITQDMLTDRLGLEEAIPVVHHSPHLGSNVSLPSVNERMSEESLEDCHAFCDIKQHPRRMSWGSDRGSVSGGGSAQGSVTGGDAGSCNNSILGTLDEEELEDSDNDLEAIDEVVVVQQFSSDGEETKSLPPNSNIMAAAKSLPHTKEEETKIMFEMLDLLSVNEEERRKLNEEKRRAMAKAGGDKRNI